MERNIQRNGIIALFVLVIVGVATFAISRYAQVLAGGLATAFLGLGVLVSAVAWFQMRLEDRERLEKLEFDEIGRGGGDSSTLFNTEQAEAFPARRAREQFEKYFVPGFTIVLLLLQAWGAWWFWSGLSAMSPVPSMSQPLMAMSVFGLLGLVLFLLGQFSAGLGRVPAYRLLRPAASYLLLGAYVLWFVVAGITGVLSGFPLLDLWLARGLCLLLGLLAGETLFTLMLEIYRPRVRGKVVRLLYDSRLVGLISHPEGIFTTLAHTLDYQFGFKVSDTWFYQFLRRSAIWLLLLYVAILAGSTSLVYVEPGEQALLERFGQPAAGRDLLGPGFHLKAPWPIEKTHIYRTQEIQSFAIGFEHEEEGEEGEEGEEHSDAVLWTVSHYQEEFHLLVASREEVDVDARESEGRKAPPVNLLSVGIPVQYQIHDLRAWAYNYSNAADLLEEIATREVVLYLVGVDVNEIMSTARFSAGETLRGLIQAKADELGLGVRILFVGLQDVHPPVAVGAAYEKLVGARHKRAADILKAQAYAIRTNAQATAEATRMRLTASAESVRRVAAARARESLFTNQMAAYNAAPSVYPHRAYLRTLSRHGAGVRKFIRILTNAPEVYQLNLEDKVRADILNVPLPASSPK